MAIAKILEKYLGRVVQSYDSTLILENDLHYDAVRYKLKLAYNGRPFAGWQVQPNEVTVQGVLQEALSRICKVPIKLTGCGRTDTGVHALKYFAHFDLPFAIPSDLLKKLNANLPDEISVMEIASTNPDWHARYHAISRQYIYIISKDGDPLHLDQSFRFYGFKQLDNNLLRKAAELLRAYKSFEPFCKHHSDATNYLCDIQDVSWVFEDNQKTFVISANRFLRGMVRLIVGMCLNVALGKIELGNVQLCLDEQAPLPMPWSVPASGLFLAEVIYPISTHN